MIKYLFLPFFILISLFPKAQVKPEKKYLLVRFFYDYDKIAQRAFYKIIPDGWGEWADEIYGLKTYSNKKSVENNTAVFFYERTDTHKVFYNYFRSPTEAFNYMLFFGWRVSLVFPDNSDNAGDQSNTLVGRQVFCFYKE